jgi:hypothetical protein
MEALGAAEKGVDASFGMLLGMLILAQSPSVTKPILCFSDHIPMHSSVEQNPTTLCF